MGSSDVIAEGSYPAPRQWLDVPATKDYSLVFPIDRSKHKVLLGLKKRGFAKGMWNGFGGKPEQGETMLQCATRELTEESGLIPTRLIERGTLLYYSQNALIREGGDHAVRVWLYTCEAWTDEPIETEEMQPGWFSFPESLSQPFDAFPWTEMHLESRLFLPTLLLLAPELGQTLSGRADFYHCDPDSELVRNLTAKGQKLDLSKKTVLGDWVMGKWVFRVESASGEDEKSQGI